METPSPSPNSQEVQTLIVDFPRPPYLGNMAQASLNDTLKSLGFDFKDREISSDLAGSIQFIYETHSPKSMETVEAALMTFRSVVGFALSFR